MKKVILLILAAAIVLSSCDTEEISLVEEQATVSDEAMIESAFEEIDDMTFAGLSENGGRIEGDGRFSCATITTATDTIFIDFGTGCEGPNGRIRAGKVIISRTAPFWQKNAVITTAFEDFSIDGNQITGVRSITNLGLNENDNHVFKVTLTDGNIIFTDGTEITRDSEFTRTWVRGANVLLDELHVNGSASGVTREGKSYSMTVMESLVYKVACRVEGFPIAVQGIKEITSGDKQISVDFGDGNCDNVITITYNGFSRDIEVDL
ncbi:MAG: hypothetical protein ACNS60_09930 [Candidatus Cyclobacteriaceae bacterium M2_1C_046]